MLGEVQAVLSLYTFLCVLTSFVLNIKKKNNPGWKSFEVFEK